MTKNRLKIPGISAHKNLYGHVAILEGAFETRGASHLAARAAFRAGAGLVTLLTKDRTSISTDQFPEVMHQLIKPGKVPVADDFLKRVSSAVIGPGLGSQKALLASARVLLSEFGKRRIPIIVDADALTFLLDSKLRIPTDTVLIATPHPGEAAKLLKTTADKIEQNRDNAMVALCELPINRRARVIWVLKGSSPIVGENGHTPTTCIGNLPALAIAGSGDVLAGLIAALCRFADDPYDAALVGVQTHLEAGRLLQNKAKRGHLASELADTLPLILWN